MLDVHDVEKQRFLWSRGVAERIKIDKRAGAALAVAVAAASSRGENI